MPEPEADKLPKDELTKRLRPRRSAAMIVKTVVVLLTAAALSGVVTYSLPMWIIRYKCELDISLLWQDPQEVVRILVEIIPGGAVAGALLGVVAVLTTLWSNQPRGVLWTVIFWQIVFAAVVLLLVAGDLAGVQGRAQTKDKFGHDPFKVAMIIVWGAAFGFFLAVFAKVLDRILPPWSRSLP